MENSVVELPILQIQHIFMIWDHEQIPANCAVSKILKLNCLVG